MGHKLWTIGDHFVTSARPQRQTLRWLLTSLLQQLPDLTARFTTYYVQLRALPRLMPRMLGSRWATSLASLTVALALGQGPSWANTIAVDGTTCTLAEAIANANDTTTGQPAPDCAPGDPTGADTITLPLGSTQTLLAALPAITSTITVEGNTSTVMRDSGAPAFRLFTVNRGGNLTLQAMTLSGGSGGGVLNSNGILTLEDCVVTGNAGGGVANAAFGVGVSATAQTTLIDTTVSQNTGGSGVANSASTRRAGAFANVEIINSTVSGNTASFGGGVSNSASALDGFATTNVGITNSTVSGNTAGRGGGVWNSLNFPPLEQARVHLTNSTVSGNTANSGGGIENNFGGLTLDHSTITQNTATNGQGGGVFTTNTASATFVEASIIASNTGTDIHDASFSPALVSEGDNLIGDGNATGSFNQPGDQIGGIDPGLEPLALNAPGTTETHALLRSSPALDAVTGGCTVTEDQRGVLRPQGGACDIGAFELESSAMPGCGNGLIESGEQCDDGNNRDGDCCSAICQIEPADTICRSVTGSCDVAETCGGAATCPVNGFVSGGVQCRPSGGECDVAESCTGSSAACPTDAKSMAQCRGAADECDVAEFCNGINNTCPTNLLRPAGSACTSDGNQCTQDICDGSSVQCMHVSNAPACGNGCVEPGEQCDDGNLFSGDGCSATCQTDAIACNCATACASPQALHVNAANATLNGTAGNDILCGDGRNNVLRGMGGSDILCGFDGVDSLQTSSGPHNCLDGGTGNDALAGSPGYEVMVGGDGNDKLTGYGGNDVMDGGPGTDTIIGGAGPDTCVNGEMLKNCP